MIFLFKQKTAYEMRISDWSSDVCSSDLIRGSHASMDMTKQGFGNRHGAGTCADRPGARSCVAVLRAQGAAGGRGSVARAAHHRQRDASDALSRVSWQGRTARDRKSVVEGKSVSVRVDLGGRRFIKKKKKET